MLCAAFVLSTAVPRPLAQTLRTVRDHTILSPELPKADLTLGNAFRYVGGQQVNLYGMADAEQHLFIRGGSNGVIDAFYWVQFEHRVPGAVQRSEEAYCTEANRRSFTNSECYPDS